MPKTTSEKLLKHYPPLREIAAEEWYDLFPPHSKWSSDDDIYLSVWWGREDIITLAYALDKPPWRLGEVEGSD